MVAFEKIHHDFSVDVDSFTSHVHRFGHVRSIEFIFIAHLLFLFSGSEGCDFCIDLHCNLHLCFAIHHIVLVQILEFRLGKFVPDPRVLLDALCGQFNIPPLGHEHVQQNAFEIRSIWASGDLLFRQKCLGGVEITLRLIRSVIVGDFRIGGIPDGVPGQSFGLLVKEGAGEHAIGLTQVFSAPQARVPPCDCPRSSLHKRSLNFVIVRNLLSPSANDGNSDNEKFGHDHAAALLVH
mmetsp:Transcript_4098/g.7579  ORF Transcript_4098/g.7579 Transcript_4098/m.7579 type:complete len:237 (+) Transcript_4098:1002-1712(+)